MSKINRHGEEESNDINSLPFWLYEFAFDLQKNAGNIDYLKQYLSQKTNKFNTIEEKLADIKERIGFDLSQKISEEMEKVSNIKEASESSSCGCGGSCCSIKTASKKSPHSKRDVDTMRNILRYIKDMVSHEPDVSSSVVLHRCKEEDGLGFKELSNKINRDKLISYIDSLLLSNKNSSNSVVYTPLSDELSSGDDVAEYYNHAKTEM